jgi:CelD/BcsL family acetyltransferase involved in cellulose biosynthesis
LLRAADIGAAEAPAARLTVEEARGRASFDALREEWDALVASGPVDLPFVTHGWISAWLDAFAPRAAPLVLVARAAGGAPLGMAPFLEERGPAGTIRLVSPANDHSCRFEWALGPDPGSAVAAIWRHLRDRVRWDVILLRDVPRDGPTSARLEPLARADRHPTGRWRSISSPRLRLGRLPAEARTSARFRSNLRRRARRLHELGAVALRRAGSPAEVDAAVADFLALESSGWKSAGGTAIALDPVLVRFYEAIARDAAARGTLAVRALTLDGRPVAMHLGVIHRGVYHLPKTAYDERLAAMSPGQLLQREVLAECEARGLAGFDFLGPDMEWKRDWEPEHAPHDWLYVYRPSLAGRLMHGVKHRVRPAVKEVLSWLR